MRSQNRLATWVPVLIRVQSVRPYVPAIEKLKKRKIPVHVVFWEHAARELKDAATKFISLDPYLEHLARVNRK